MKFQNKMYDEIYRKFDVSFVNSIFFCLNVI